jgi:hypothetical protein
MAEFEMEIRGKTTLTFPITPEFFPGQESTWKRDGKQEFIQDAIPVHGWFSDNDVDVLDTKIRQLHALAENRAPLIFIFRKTSGTVLFQLNQGHIENLKEEQSDASRVNHVEFTFSITEERQGTITDLVRFKRTDRETDGRDSSGGIRKVKERTVTATGEFGNLAAAKKWVLGQKPIGDILNIVEEEESFDGTFTITWTYDVTESTPGFGGQDGNVFRWDERVNLRPGLKNTTWKRTGAAPFPISGGRGQSRLDVTGTVSALNEAGLPSADEILGRFLGILPGVSGEELVDFNISGIRALSFSADKPSEPVTFERTYSFGIEFGEAVGDPLPPSAGDVPPARFDRAAAPANPPGGFVPGVPGVGAGVPL